MRNLLRLLLKQHLLILFLFLEIIAFSMLVRHNNYQNARFYSIRHSIVGNLSNRFSDYSKYLSLEEQNQALVIENAKLYHALPLSIYNLKDESFVDSVGIQQYQYIPATVINNSVNKQYNYITINRGRIHGIEKDMGVIGPEGLVGIVKTSSDHFASVIPILNREFFPNARIKGSNFFGYLEWNGKNYQQAVLRDIPLHASLQIGDTIETSGNTAIFPQGIPIGTIADYEILRGINYNITVNLFTDFKRLNSVFVIKNILRKEQQELEETLAHD